MLQISNRRVHKVKPSALIMVRYLNEYDAEEMYDEWLDSMGEVEVCGLTYLASRVLQAVDPVAYRCGFNDFLDAEGFEIDNDY